MYFPGPTLLDALTPSDRARLFDHGCWRALSTGEQLFPVNDREFRAYLLLSGLMKLCARVPSGDETIVYLGLPGELIGDIGLLDGLPQPHEALAAAPSEVLGFEGDLLMDVLHSSPGAALEVARSCAQRLRWVSETSFERALRDVPARLAGRLLDLADLMGEVRDSAIEFELPLHQRDLGRLAGMCRESACKAINRFRRNGLIEYEDRTMRILRPDLLERVRCGGRGAIPFP